MISTIDSGRRPLTVRQRRGLRKREEENPSFNLSGVFDAGGGWEVTGFPGSRLVIAHNPHEEAMGLDLARLTARAIGEASDFAEFGPGKWMGNGETHRWESALDEKGNDRVIPNA